eukprot:gene58825-80561_t
MAEADTQDIAENARKYWSAEGYTEGGVIREVDYASQSGGLHPSLEGIKIVDTDTHITEAPDLFTSRAPASYKDKVPYVKLDADGVERWCVGDRNFGSMGGNVIRNDNNKLLGRLAFPKLEQAHPGGHAVAVHACADDNGGNAVPIGKGANGAQLLVVDAGKRLLGIGELGEIAVRSNHLCLGELNHEGLIVPLTPQHPNDAAIYCTGDY